MKVLVVVALLAFVAVQSVSSAPVPDEDKKEVVATPVAAAEPPAAPAASAAEVKSVTPEQTPLPTPEAAPAEEKKA